MVNTISGMSQEHGENYAEHKVIGGRPVLEWVGRNTSTYSIEMRLDSSLGTMPSVVIAGLKKMMQAHKPVPLLVGPQYCGQVVIEGVSVTSEKWTGIGVLQVAKVSVKLKGVSDGFF
ncbi:MAG: phage tail protein [Desulfovibrio sp.]|nr:phage tail protein [Desulfovibrio sp.]